MAGPRKLQKGTRLSGIPADSWNAFVDATKRINQAPGIPNGPAQSSGPSEQVQILVQNKTGAALTERFPILRLGDPVVTPADITDTAQVVLRGVQFEGEEPDADTAANFVVMQGPCDVDQFRPATLLGSTWAKVDIQADGDTHATSIDGDSDKLTSGASGHRILWPLTGTGEKWCVILIGAGSGSTLAYGRLIADVPARDWVLDALILEEIDPVTNSLEDGDTIAVFNMGFQPMRGSVGLPVPLRGEVRSFTYDDEFDVEQTTRIMLVTPYDQNILPGSEESPANGKGQAGFHAHGEREGQADGSPCGGE